MFRPRRRRQLEHAHEHGRYPLAVADPVAGNGGERRLRIEALHDHQCRATAQEAEAEAQRGRVIERCRREIDGFRCHAVKRAQGFPARIDGAQRIAGQRYLDALGPARCAGRIEHVRAFALVDNGLRGLGRHGILESLEAGAGAVEHEPMCRPRHCGEKGLGNIGLGGGANIQTGAAIADDIGRLVAAQVGGEAGISQPGAMGAPANGQEPGVVLQA